MDINVLNLPLLTETQDGKVTIVTTVVFVSLKSCDLKFAIVHFIKGSIRGSETEPPSRGAGADQLPEVHAASGRMFPGKRDGNTFQDDTVEPLFYGHLMERMD